MSEQPPLPAKQIRKIKRKNEKQQIENYKTEIGQLSRCEFSGLTEAQRTYLREYALEIGKIPRLRGPGEKKCFIIIKLFQSIFFTPLYHAIFYMIF